MTRWALLVATAALHARYCSSWTTSCSNAFCTKNNGVRFETKLFQSTAATSSINPLLSQIQPSKTVEIFSMVKQMQAEGTEVVSLCVGEPDFPPPQAVLDATVKALQDGETKYTAVTGTLGLRQAIAADLEKRKSIKYDPLTEVVVGNGAKQSVYQAILATCGSGDAVIVPAPYWPSYPEMVKLVGATPVVLTTKAENGYKINPESLDSTLQKHPNAKLLILCNPSNPTGTVHSRQDLQAIANVLKKHPNVLVLADEIYEQLVYNETHVAMASLDSMWDRTLTINGFSKAYSMTGMRLGYVAAPAPYAKAIATIQSQFTSCAGSLSQAAGVAALTNVSQEEMDQNVQIMREKRDYVMKRLEEMNLVPPEPQGAFYVLPQVGGDDAQLCIDLLQTKQLALVPGSSFGAPGTVRISYATSMEELTEAMDRLESFLKEQDS